MPAHRMNMRMIKDVLRLKFDGGFSHDRIAASLGISKGVVTKYLGLAGAAGLDWASASDMDEGELERRLLGKPTGPAAYAQPDYGHIHQELRRKGVTEEELARLHGPIGLDVGAVTPEEIAIAVLAEMTAVKYGRTARPLKDLLPTAQAAGAMAGA